jgi:single-strand DNA-binding protein
MIKIIVSGRVGNDAELKTVGDTTVCTFSVAHTEKIYGPTPSEKTIWVSCNIWGERGPKLAPHITKGTFVVVEGSGTVNSYLQKNGDPAAILNCKVVSLEFGGKPNGTTESTSVTNTGYTNPLNNPVVQELKTKLNLDEELPF